MMGFNLNLRAMFSPGVARRVSGSVQDLAQSSRTLAKNVIKENADFRPEIGTLKQMRLRKKSGWFGVK